MIWLKVDGIEFKPESETVAHLYGDNKVFDYIKPEVIKIKVKIGDTTLEGIQHGDVVVVNDEKLNNALTIAEASRESFEQGYENGKHDGYSRGYKRALSECAKFVNAKREEYNDETHS